MAKTFCLAGAFALYYGMKDMTRQKTMILSANQQLALAVIITISATVVISGHAYWHTQRIPLEAAAIRIDLNTASKEELTIVPGIGPSTAVAIARLREKKGGFRKVEDLLEVKGIGPRRLEKIRRFVRCE